jgi:AraC-like DNA-binding protein
MGDRPLPRAHLNNPVIQGAAIAAGDNLTTAAMKAGFASPSHLADRFKTTFGLSASQLLGTGLTLRTP